MPTRKSKVKQPFDPNKSDSEDENFELEATRNRKPTRRSRPQTKKSSQKKRRRRNEDSDISQDSDESDEEEESYSDDIELTEPEMDEVTGRPKRKAKEIAKNYAESEDDDKNLDEEQPAKKKRQLVKLKLPPEKMPLGKTPKRQGSAARGMPSSTTTRRATRAATAEQDEELVQLSNSGRHVLRASRTPEPTRSSRAAKSVKQPAVIKEAAHESSSYENAADDDMPMIEPDIVDEDDNAARSIRDSHDEADEGEDNVEDADAQGEMEDKATEMQADDDEDDEDDGPVTAKGRSRGKQAATEPDDDDDGMDEHAEPVEQDATTNRRLTRKSAAAKNKQDEEASDFSPDHDSADDDLSGSEALPNKPKGDDDDDDDESPVGRGRSTRRGRGKSQASRRRGQSNSELDEEQSPEKEALEELQELGRRPHRRPKDIQYEPRQSRPRAPAGSYAIKPLTDLDPVDEDNDAVVFDSPSKRGGKAGANKSYSSAWASTLGPFGGGGGPAPIVGGGLWGTGVAGGGDPDSSDDEGGGAQRPAETGGNPNMTPIMTMAPQLFPGLGQGGNNPELNSAAPANVGQVKSTKVMADIDPLGVDRNIDFSKVGGLAGHVDQLKEMVQMPLLYPEVFMKFNITPPRGVLFHGPPGTGKTLLARALAAQVGDGQQKISFYMRKGADTLSKWVGEAERQLGLLFEQARKTQPSIIFFDEIDGLAPVRSSKQDQTHSSIVATLLALMDGMDGRGQVIVIGATNRPDSVDPALRRPGRFDREFYFPLPDTSGRLEILDIHTKGWGIDDRFKANLADLTKGYGGADIRALCTEATLNAIQRTFPQIYSSNKKLLIDSSKIKVNAKDFMLSIKKVVPSSERSTSSGAAPLPKVIEPILREQFKSIKERVENLLPITKKVTALQEALYEQYDDADDGFGREILQQEFEKARIFRPRLLIKGLEGMGQNYLGGALLHNFEGVHVQNFDLSTIYSDSSRSPEAAVVQLFTEAKRHKPSVIYLSGIDTWYQTVGASVITTFQGMLKSIATTDPILVLGISDCEDTNEELEKLFSFSHRNTFTIEKPTADAREEFFAKVVDYCYLVPNDFPDPAKRKMRKLDVLPEAPPPPPYVPSKEELLEQKRKDLQLLNQLKIRLQPIMDEMKKKYRKYFSPAVPRSHHEYLFHEHDPDFVRPDVSQSPRAYELDKDKDGVTVLKETATGRIFYNLELTTIEERLANGYYCRAKDFLKDIRDMVQDHNKMGDQNQKFKGSQLLANVEIDVDIIERLPILAECENLYQRRIQRAKEEKEKEDAENGAARASPVQREGFAPGSQAPESTAGRSQAPTPPVSTSSQSQPFSNGGHVYEGSSAELQNPRLSNGSSGSAANDTEMSGIESHPSDLSMGPPATPSAQFEWNGMRGPPNPARNISANATAASSSQYSFNSQSQPQTQSQQYASQQQSQSAYVALPPGTRLSDISQGDASTTESGKRTTPRESLGSNAYQEFDSQLYDMLPSTQSEGAGPGTQPNSQSFPSSRSEDHVRRYDSSNPNSSGDIQNNYQPPVSGFHQNLQTRIPLAQVLNPVDPPEALPSTASTDPSSEPQSQPIIMAPESGEHIKSVFVEGTKGCTVEMLEQIYRELMVEIWNERSNNNRAKVGVKLVARFEEVIKDIEEVRGLEKGSLARGW